MQEYDTGTAVEEEVQQDANILSAQIPVQCASCQPVNVSQQAGLRTPGESVLWAKLDNISSTLKEFMTFCKKPGGACSHIVPTNNVSVFGRHQCQIKKFLLILFHKIGK